MQILFIDTETTGLSADANDVIQMGGVFWVDGEVKREINYFCQPVNWESVGRKALEINHPKLTYEQAIEMLRSYQSPRTACAKLQMAFKSLNTGEKWKIGGQNVKFDHKFMSAFFKKNAEPGTPLWEDLVDYETTVELMDFTKPLKNNGRLNVPNVKLGTIAEAVGVKPEGDLHTALVDIQVTLESLIEVTKLYEAWIGDDATISDKMPLGARQWLYERGLIT
jgi:DNA polymerase III epsilon subunit-like protein